MEKLYSCRKSILALICVIFYLFSCNADSSFVVYKGQSEVIEGSCFEILCQVSVFSPLKWQQDGILMLQDNNTEITIKHDPKLGVVSILSIKNASMAHSGEYRCNPLSELGHSIQVISAEAEDLTGNFDFQNFKVIEFKTDLVLQCNYTKSTGDNLSLKWMKNEVPIKEGEGVKIIPAENKLVVEKAGDGETGNYSCSLFNSKTNSTSQRLDFRVISKPYVKVVPNTSVVEGEKLIIACLVLGDPSPEVSWMIGNKTYTENEGRVKLMESKDKGIPNSVLQIDEAVMEDRDVYTCIGTDKVTKNTTFSATNVRVKDKLAALWPFLGICAEVVILCTVILIYEKKRNKTEMDESDTDGSPEQKNTPDHGKDSEVRHRK